MNTFLSEQTQRCCSFAIRVAKSCGSETITPEFMMVALIQQAKAAISFILRRLNIDKVSFCQQIGNAANQNIENAHTGTIDPRPSEKLEEIIAVAEQIASDNGAQAIEPEHIFWAFDKVDTNVKAIMDNFGITEEKISEAVAALGRRADAQGEPQAEQSPSRSYLSEYAQDLLILAENNEIEPAIGRDYEISRILQTLSRKTKNNPLLIGPSGVGKTAIVEGLAFRLLRGDVPEGLKNIRIYSLSLTSLISGTSRHGEFEERLKCVIEEAKADSNIVLFIDEIHELMDAWGSMNAANILKPELARGDIKVIGATTTDEYTKYMEKDKALERRFQKIAVNEPDTETAITIMRGIKSKYENFHQIKIRDDALVAAVELSQRYITERFLPDKAIDLLDEAASKKRIEQVSVPQELDLLERKIKDKEMELESLSQDGDDTDLSSIKTVIQNLKDKKDNLSERWQERSPRNDEATRLDEDDIREEISSMTGIPVERIGEDESQKLLHMPDVLKASVIGQDQAVEAIAKVIRRNRLGLGDANKPIGSFLFLGTTGVGKTELAKTLAEYLFNDRSDMIRIDMSEYQQDHTVSRLFGAPPGYVGFEAGGQLTEAVRHKPYCVILFDEIEKAHPKVFETLLQVLDDGRMTDGQGRTVNFKNSIIIMTSNIGARELTQLLCHGEVSSSQLENAKQACMYALKQEMSPEFINRIDEIVMFRPLEKKNIRKIAQLKLSQEEKRLAQKDIDIHFDESVVDFVADNGFNPEYGARPVQRVINDFVIEGISMALLQGSIKKSKPITAMVQNNELILK